MTSAPVRRFAYTPRGPYSLVATAARFTRWPEVVDRFDGETYRRLLPVGAGGLLVTVRQSGPVSRARLRVELRGTEAAGPEARRQALRVVENVLGAGLDTRAFVAKFREDALLADALRHSRGLRVAGTASLWEALVTAVLAQQVNLAFAYDIRRELCLAFGRKARGDGQTYVAFPQPERVARESEAALRRFRLSRSKAAAIAGLAAASRPGRSRRARSPRFPTRPPSRS